MPEQRAAPVPEPTPEELEEIVRDLDFFLEMDEATALPLEEEPSEENGDDERSPDQP